MTAPARKMWADALGRLDDAATAASPDAPELSRPAAIEYLGQAVAKRLASDRVELVLSWDRTDDATLAHVVARELAVDAVLVFEPVDGQLSFDRDPAPGQRVAFVAISFSWLNSLRAPIAFVAARGARVVRVVALAESPAVPSELDDTSIFLPVDGS